ncbi:MAG: GGDEF domain-containing protein [Verrucomicrobia bacterium]|nr:GGDEF domain-containing protein [Deltaproteobacteria bacterium]
MDESQQNMVATGVQQRFKGYDRIMGNISWLLIAMVALATKLMPSPDDASIAFLAIFCVLLFFYNVNARYGVLSRRYSQFKTFIDLIVFLAFIVAVCWYTGKLTSPFLSLIYLILMATALTQGRRITYLMAGLAITSYVLLASADFREINYYLTHILEIFPYMLIAHLGALLADETESARREVERLSLIDDVTGINNMRNFFMLADTQEKMAKRYERRFAICMIDADDLKTINDRHGHFAGTELIRQVAAMITSNIRSSDICARYGGDEFVIMFNETNKDEVAAAVERIVADMAALPFSFEGGLLASTLSAGLAGYPEDGPDVKTVMANADEAMYVSKRTGKNRLTIYAEDMAALPSVSPEERDNTA